jgi:hypothetical protein
MLGESLYATVCKMKRVDSNSPGFVAVKYLKPQYMNLGIGGIDWWVNHRQSAKYGGIFLTT